MELWTKLLLSIATAESWTCRSIFGNILVIEIIGIKNNSEETNIFIKNFNYYIYMSDKFL